MKIFFVRLVYLLLDIPIKSLYLYSTFLKVEKIFQFIYIISDYIKRVKILPFSQ